MVAQTVAMRERALGCEEPRPPERRPRTRAVSLGDRSDVGRFRTLRALALLELHARALGERLEAVAGDAAVMDEEILRSLVGGDEAVPLRIVEPLDDSVGHG